uniref:Uncharacterized protein n=1 Tax=Rhizophora mucronata TaxID=61149 RepID=A0A2P2NDB2_RHIMU
MMKIFIIHKVILVMQIIDTRPAFCYK